MDDIARHLRHDVDHLDDCWCIRIAGDDDGAGNNDGRVPSLVEERPYEPDSSSSLRSAVMSTVTATGTSFNVHSPERTTVDPVRMVRPNRMAGEFVGRVRAAPHDDRCVIWQCVIADVSPEFIRHGHLRSSSDLSVQHAKVGWARPKDGTRCRWIVNRAAVQLCVVGALCFRSLMQVAVLGGSAATARPASESSANFSGQARFGAPNGIRTRAAGLKDWPENTV